MIEKDHPGLSIRRQAELLGVNRNRLEVAPRVSQEDRQVMRDLDELHTRWPVYGQRKLLRELRARGWSTGRKRVRRLMRVMGLEAIAPRPRTSIPDAGHRKYPYLLRNLDIDRPDQVWCTDITYIPMGRGFAYLTAIMDWHSRAVLSWRVSNTLDTRFCLEALADAARVAGRAPEILNTDQGCQYTSAAWTGAVEGIGSESQHGRQGPLGGQRLHRAALAQPQVRGHPPARLPRPGGAGAGSGPLDGRLQPPAHPPGAGLPQAVGLLPAASRACRSGVKG